MGPHPPGAAPSISVVLLALGKDGVELALGLVEHLDRAVPLLAVALEADLAQRVHDAHDRLAGVLPGGDGLLAELVPRRVGRGLARLGLAGLGERIGLAAATLLADLADDQALVLQQLQR